MNNYFLTDALDPNQMGHIATDLADVFTFTEDPATRSA